MRIVIFPTILTWFRLETLIFPGVDFKYMFIKNFYWAWGLQIRTRKT
jgi:hypothetical protein